MCCRGILILQTYLILQAKLAGGTVRPQTKQNNLTTFHKSAAARTAEVTVYTRKPIQRNKQMSIRDQHALSLIGVTGAHRLPPAWFGGNYPFNRGPVVFRQFWHVLKCNIVQDHCVIPREAYTKDWLRRHVSRATVTWFRYGRAGPALATPPKGSPNAPLLARGILLCDLPGRPNRRGNDISDAQRSFFARVLLGLEMQLMINNAGCW